MSIIDILELVDRLEELLEQGWRLPVVNCVVIDEGQFLNIIDQMRLSIPQDVKLAQELQRSRDRYITQAQEEARQIIADARQSAEHQVKQTGIQSAAQSQGRQILRDAEQEAARIRSGADQYAEEQLKTLGRQLSDLLRTVRNGLALLEQQRKQQESAGSVASNPAYSQPRAKQRAAQNDAEYIRDSVDQVQDAV